ncbi:MAG: CdaR family protein [Anaerolineae bacterium]
MRKLVNTVGSLLLALVLALIVWVGATSAENPITTGWYQGQIPIRVQGQPQDTVIVTAMEAYAQARITAPQDYWDTIRVSDFDAYVDLSQVSIGSNVNVPVTVKVLKRGIRLSSFKPASVTVRLEQYVTKEVPVHANIIDDPALGYVARSPIVEPTTVTVGGPAPAVAQVEYVSVDIWLRGSQVNIERNIAATPMDRDDSQVSDVAVMPPLVNVKVELAQRANFKPSVPIRAQLQGDLAPLYWISNITVKPASVTLVGLPSALEQIPGFVETEPVNIDKATAPISQRVALKLPPGVSVMPESAQEEASQMVQVDVSVQPVTGGLILPQVPVHMQGLAPQFTARLSPENVDVYLSGPLVQLQSLTVDQIEVTVNLVDMGEGSHQLTPTVIVPAGIEIKGLAPEAVVVEIVGSTPTSVPSAQTSTLSGTPTANAG